MGSNGNFNLNILDNVEWFSNEPITTSTRPGKLFEKYRNQQLQASTTPSVGASGVTTTTRAASVNCYDLDLYNSDLSIQSSQANAHKILNAAKCVLDVLYLIIYCNSSDKNLKMDKKDPLLYA